MAIVRTPTRVEGGITADEKVGHIGVKPPLGELRCYLRKLIRAEGLGL